MLALLAANQTRSVLSDAVALIAGTSKPRRLATMLNPTPLPEAIAVGVDLTEPLMTAQQVAQLLAVPRSSVYEYARRLHNPLPSIGVGRHRRFYRSDVELWLARQRG